MNLQIIDGEFSVCKTKDYSQVNPANAYCFTGKTEDEYSLVCLTADVPGNTIAREDGWKAFRIQGVLEFSLVGILAKIATLLAENGISIFAISTFNTDYVLIKRETFAQALDILAAAGYDIS